MNISVGSRVILKASSRSNFVEPTPHDLTIGPTVFAQCPVPIKHTSTLHSTYVAEGRIYTHAACWRYRLAVITTKRSLKVEPTARQTTINTPRRNVQDSYAVSVVIILRVWPENAYSCPFLAVLVVKIGENENFL